jgi:hypothetical protein
VQTFVDAYNGQQEAAYRKEQMDMEREMDRILFPIKQQQGQLSLEKMNLEMEKTKGEIERQRILTRQMTDVQRNVNQGFNSGLANPGSNGQGYQSKFGFGRSITPTPATTGTSTAPRVVGSGVQPKGT